MLFTLKIKALYLSKAAMLYNVDAHVSYEIGTQIEKEKYYT